REGVCLGRFRALVVLPIYREAVALGSYLHAVGEAVIHDEIVSQLAQAHFVAAVHVVGEEVSVTSNQVDGFVGLAVSSGETLYLLRRDRLCFGDWRQIFTGFQRKHEPKRLARDARHGGIGTVHGRHRGGADLIVGKNLNLRRETIHRAAMADKAVAVQLIQDETQPEITRSASTRKLRRQHFFQALRFEDLAVESSALGEKSGYEQAEVGYGRVHVPGGRGSELELRRFPYPAVIAPLIRFSQVLHELWLRLECARLHPQRPQNGLLQISGKAFAVHALQDVTDGSNA